MPSQSLLIFLLVQRGRHLDFSQAVADAVKTAAERAEEIDDSLKTFMFVIPKVCLRPYQHNTAIIS